MKTKEIIETTRLENGLTILTEKIPYLRSATVGFWLRKGARHEPAELNGILHFIEHTVFKGTPTNSMLEIARKIDRLGGNLDAYTMHETVGFSFQTVDDNLPEAFDLLADMLCNPLFDEKELKQEQKVIIEELKMVEDSPDELLSELFQAAVFPDNGLGRCIGGTKKTVKTFNREVTKNFHAEIFTPANLVVACVGNVEHKKVIALVEKFFKNQKTKIEDQKSTIEPPKFTPTILLKKRLLEQAQMFVAAPFISLTDERRYAGMLLSSILGGGASSRLWQKVREERGLAYSVGASSSMYQDCGIFSIYAGTATEKVGEVLDLAVAEMREIVKNGVTEAELELVKEQMKASILLGLESTAVRAENMAKQEITYGRQISPEETLKYLENVQAEEIQKLAREFFRTENIAFGALGDLGKLKIKRERLEI